MDARIKGPAWQQSQISRCARVAAGNQDAGDFDAFFDQFLMLIVGGPRRATSFRFAVMDLARFFGEMAADIILQLASICCLRISPRVSRNGGHHRHLAAVGGRSAGYGRRRRRRYWPPAVI